MLSLIFIALVVAPALVPMVMRPGPIPAKVRNRV